MEIALSIINIDKACSIVNVAYVLTETGYIDEAQAILERSIAKERDEPIACYDLGIVYTKKRFFEKATVEFQRVIDLSKGEAVECFCLIAIEQVENEIVYKEEREPDIILLAQKAISVLRGFES